MRTEWESEKQRNILRAILECDRIAKRLIQEPNWTKFTELLMILPEQIRDKDAIKEFNSLSIDDRFTFKLITKILLSSKMKTEFSKVRYHLDDEERVNRFRYMMQKEIAQQLFIQGFHSFSIKKTTKQSFYNSLEKYEEKGLIRRVKDEKGKLVQVKLMQKGYDSLFKRQEK